jgi:hypothetical protein
MTGIIETIAIHWGLWLMLIVADVIVFGICMILFAGKAFSDAFKGFGSVSFGPGSALKAMIGIIKRMWIFAVLVAIEGVLDLLFLISIGYYIVMWIS